MAQQESINVHVNGDEKDNENETLTKLMRYVQKNNVRKILVEWKKIRDKDHLKTLLNTQINDTYLIVEAAKYNNLSMVKQLVEHHVNISSTDANGRTALYLSCYYNNDKMCEYLMAHGADPNIVTSSKSTPFTYAAFKGNLKMMKYLFNEEKKFCHSFDWVRLSSAWLLLFLLLYVINFVVLLAFVC